MTIFYIDGMPLEIRDKDYYESSNKQPKKLGTSASAEENEYAASSGSTQDIIQPTEVGAAMEQLNRDNLDTDTRMSEIDFRARLHPLEIPYVLQIDALVALGVLPPKCLMLTRCKKRISVSERGLGRQELVSMMHNKSAHDVEVASGGGGGMMDKIKNFMGGRT